MSYSGGVHSYTRTVSRPGEITIIVKRYTRYSIHMEYYSNMGFTGGNAHTSTSSNVNFNWGLGRIFSSYYDYVSIKMFFRIRAPITGSVTFYTDTDDQTRFFLDGVQILNRVC